ncbi:MAG: zinc ABC transporter substrate-binding protein [Pseudomonadota bacterium]
MLKHTALCLILATPAYAAPQVATDIAPVHSLVAQVMEGVGEPSLLIDPTTNPHVNTMRPSEARALQEAEIIFGIGSALTPWLDDVVENLAPAASTYWLIEQAPVIRVYGEEGDDHDEHDEHGDEEHAEHKDEHDEHGHEEHSEGEHDHDDHAEHKDEHDHDDHAEHKDEHDDHDHEEHAEHKDEHDDHDHEEHAEHKDEHDEHDHEEHAEHDDHGHEGHDHSGGDDPHAWLDPVNAQAWLGYIAQTLADADPANAEAYNANAVAAQSKLAAQQVALTEQLAPADGLAFLAYHDAYSYFGARFGMVSLGSLASNEGAPPSAADMRRAEEFLEHGDTTCLMTEVQYGTKAMDALATTDDITVATIDPLGAASTPGPALYGEVLQALADQFVSCVK